MPVINDQLKITPAAVLTSTAASQVVQTTAGGNLIMGVPGSSRLSSNTFTVLASGYAQGGAGTYTATITPILYGDVSLATVTTKPLFTATAGTVAYTGTAATGQPIPWNITANFIGRGSGAFLGGEAESTVNGTYKIRTQTTASVTAVDWSAEPPVKFAVGCTAAGTVGASFKFVVEQFQVVDD